MSQPTSVRILIAPVFLFFLLSLSACGDVKVNQKRVAAAVAYSVGDTLEVSGILIDTRCFAANSSNAGMNHADPVPTSQTGPTCAKYCALQGFPVGLLEFNENATTWMLLSNSQLLSDYMGRTVRIRAVVRSQGVLIPERVEAKVFEDKWTYVL